MRLPASSFSAAHWTRPFLISAAYGALFVLFDTQATVFETAPGVSPWYPSAGLNLALVLIFGLRYLPLVFAALFASGVFISEPALPWPHLLLPNLVLTAGYGAAAAWLRRHLGGLHPMSLKAVNWLLAVALGLPALVAPLAVLGYTLTGLEGYSLEALPHLAFSWWRGDAVGLLTLTPLLFWAVAPYVPHWRPAFEAEDRFGARLSSAGALLEAAVQVAAVGLVLYLVFYVLPGGSFHFYLFFLPLLWMALRHGLPRATLGVFAINLSAVLAMAHHQMTETVLPFQLFMIALALTGLLLGALTSERRRAVRSLRQVRRRLAERLNSDASPSPRPTLSSGETLQVYIGQLQQEQEQLADTGQALRELNARKDAFFSLLSHDLKNLLFSSVQLSEVLATDAATLSRPQIEAFAGDLLDASRRTYDLLDNLLQWARVQTGQMPHHPESLSARALVEEHLRLFADHARHKDLTLESDVPAALHVRADGHTTRTVLRNLLSNAIKFTEPGGRISVRVRLQEDECIRFAVTDTGVGIAPDDLDKLFHIDQYLSTPGTDDERGSGLGLLLCQEMVEQNGGRLWAESTPGEGSTFYFTLPSADPLPLTEDGHPIAAALSDSAAASATSPS